MCDCSCHRLNNGQVDLLDEFQLAPLEYDRGFLPFAACTICNRLMGSNSLHACIALEPFNDVGDVRCYNALVKCNQLGQTTYESKTEAAEGYIR